MRSVEKTATALVTTTDLITNVTTPPPPAPEVQGDPNETFDIGSVPLIYIGIVVFVMILICKKLWELHIAKSNAGRIDDEVLIADLQDIRLDQSATEWERHYDRIDADSRTNGYFPPGGFEVGVDEVYDHQAHHYPDYPIPIEDNYQDQYRYHSQHHRHPYFPSRQFSDRSDSQSYEFSKHSSHSQRGKRSSNSLSYQHQPYSSTDSPERFLLQAQDSLRVYGKEGMWSRGRNNNSGLSPLPPVHENKFVKHSHPHHRVTGSATNARQLRINTLLNQNTSTASIYSGDLLIPSNPVPRKKSSSETKTSAVSDSGSLQLPLRERIRRYSLEKRSRSSNRMTPEKDDCSDYQEEIDQELPLKERIRRYSLNKSRSLSRDQGGDEMIEETNVKERESPRDRSRQRSEERHVSPINN